MNKPYIVFLCNKPTKKNSKDGMIQRELSIDKIFDSYNRVYIDTINRTPKLFKHPIKWFANKFNFNLSQKLVNKRVHFYNGVKQKQLKKILINSSLIYIHSIHSLKNLPFHFIQEFSHKIVLDIHGCVVEELKFININPEIISELEKKEAFTFPKIKALISVSDNMTKFYQKKYPHLKTPFLKLPIFLINKVDLKLINNKKNLNVIYSGGVQKWQNIDLMLNSMRNLPSKFNLFIFTSNVEYFVEKINKYKNFHKVDIESLSTSKLELKYKTADFGYILRENIDVNKISCPTKIIDYFNYGIIPIVSQPEIGDFNQKGYSYILKDDFEKGSIPDSKTLKRMRLNNLSILNTLLTEKKNSISYLLKLIK